MNAYQLFQDEFSYALSPLREAAAYEALWDEDKSSVKKIAEKFIQHNKYQHLSLLIDPVTIDNYVEQLEKILGKLDVRFGVHFIGEADYPTKLLDAKHPVPLLYCIGAWDLVFSPSVAIVGTRYPTAEGIKRTEKLVKLLVNDHYTITAGLAKGIDTAAHKAAIACGGKTIAVIGTSILDQYPKENKALQNEIASQYLLVSQVPLIRYQHQDYQKNRFFFPERNKTMSALTLATVIIEAGETSGSLIQAKAALEQGRKLFILDSCFQNKELTWPDKLYEKGAIRVKDYDDILAALKDED
jgi:DNA processing protein